MEVSFMFINFLVVGLLLVWGFGNLNLSNFTFDPNVLSSPVDLKPCIEVLNREMVVFVLVLNFLMILLLYFQETHNIFKEFKYKLELFYFLFVFQIVLNVLLIFTIF